ncbi:MAG: MFS transporter, partial [Gammaproteobacteria bacterium]
VCSSDLYIGLTVGYSMISVVMNTYHLWGVQVFVRLHEIPVSKAGFMVGSVIAILGTLGILTGGWLNDRLRAAGHEDAALKVGILAALCMIPFTASATLVDSVWLTLCLMLPIGFFTSFGFGASGAAIVLLTPSEIRGTVAAVYLFVLNMIAMGLGPLLTALMNDHVFHSDLAVGRSVAVVATTALVLSTILLAWGRPHFRDLSERSRAGDETT